MTTAIIVQARMNSSRLPGKVMMKLGHATVLSHVLERCKAVAGIDVVCCATVEGPDGDPVASEALACGVEVFRGSEKDVLDRYYQAARKLGADVVMRLTSDNPLMDPDICAQALELRATENADYVSNNTPPSWPHGMDCEAFTFKWLERAAREAEKPSEREHVTPFIRDHVEAKKVNLAGPQEDCSNYRWTLDTPDDFSMLEQIFDELPPGPSGWNWQVARAIVDKSPHLQTTNSGYDPLAGLNKSHAEDTAWAESWLGKSGFDESYTRLGCAVDFTDDTGRRIVSLRRQDLLSIMHWRNDQIDILRQSEPLTPPGQKTYYENHVQPTFGQVHPSQVLVSYLLDGACIGYGGLTNIDWGPRRAEISFLISTERSKDPKVRDQDFAAYLRLIKKFAFDGLKLNRLFTEAYDVRPHIIRVLEENGFKHEGRLRNHVVVEGQLTDSVLQACLREDEEQDR